MEIQNEYWDELWRLVETGAVDYDKDSRTVKAISGNVTTLNLLGLRYSPTISDPDLVEYVAKVCGNSIVEVGAGNGYWSYLLQQYGKKVAAYDTEPPRTGWLDRGIHKLDMFRRVLAVHDQDTLICMSDRYPFNTFVKSVKRFNGNRMLFSAERDPNSTSALREILEREWVLASQLKGVTRQLVPRVVYEYQRKTAAWNQQTRLMPIYTPQEVASD